MEALERHRMKSARSKRFVRTGKLRNRCTIADSAEISGKPLRVWRRARGAVLILLQGGMVDAAVHWNRVRVPIWEAGTLNREPLRPPRCRVAGGRRELT